MHAVAKTAAVRALSLVPTAIATLAISRLVLGHYGLRTFNGYVLVVSTMALLPLNDLGVGAAVTSAYATSGPGAEADRVTLTAARVLGLSTLGVAVVALTASALGAWPALLGDAAETGATFGVAIAAYALSFVPGLGLSILLGVQRSHVAVLVQMFVMPVALVGIAAAIALDASAGAALVVPAAALTIVMVAVALVAGRSVGLRWSQLLRQLPSRSRHPGSSIRSMAGPALLIALSVPLALQSDRLVLSHVSSDDELARYAVCVQIFAPLVALIGAAAQPLWPLFTKARAEGRPPPSMTKVLLAFTAATAVAGTGLALIADPIAGLISDGEVDLGLALPFANALVVLALSASFPLAMGLMEPTGLRLVARLCAVALPTNVVLSVVLAEHLGAPGPLVASACVSTFVQFLPAAVHYRRRRRLPPEPGDPSDPVVLPSTGVL